MLKQAIVCAFVAAFSFSASAGITPIEGLEGFQSAQPAASVFQKQFIPASLDGKYQIRMISDRYASVFDPEGSPIAIFDLALNHLGWGEIILGGIGFNDLNLRAFFHLFKKAKNNAKQDLADSPDTSVEDVETGIPEQGLPMTHEQAVKAGKEAFKDMRFSDEWAVRHDLPKSHDGKGVPFQLSSFTLSDLQMPNEDVRKGVMKPFELLAQVMYPEENWTPESLKAFTDEFEFRYDDKNPGYKVVWNMAKRKEKKPAPLPGVLVNFMNPWQNLVYKANLHSISTYGETMVYLFGNYGRLYDYIVSRICQHLTQRLDYHENQLLSVLETAERYEYVPGDYPMELVDVTIDELYLNKLTSLNDPNVTIGMAKRKGALAGQEAARTWALRTLKGLSKKGISLSEVDNGKFGIARDKAGEFKGIYGLSTPPLWPVGLPSLHVNVKTPAFKVAERYMWDIAAFAARDFLPNNIYFRIWKINISFRITPDDKDDMVRQRMVREINREGELLGLLRESKYGRLSLGLNAAELDKSIKTLHATYINPWRLDLAEEPSVISKNLKVLKERLSGGSPRAWFTGEKMVPVQP